MDFVVYYHEGGTEVFCGEPCYGIVTKSERSEVVGVKQQFTGGGLAAFLPPDYEELITEAFGKIGFKHSVDIRWDDGDLFVDLSRANVSEGVAILQYLGRLCYADLWGGWQRGAKPNGVPFSKHWALCAFFGRQAFAVYQSSDMSPCVGGKVRKSALVFSGELKAEFSPAYDRPFYELASVAEEVWDENLEFFPVGDSLLRRTGVAVKEYEYYAVSDFDLGLDYASYRKLEELLRTDEFYAKMYGMKLQHCFEYNKGAFRQDFIKKVNAIFSEATK